MKSLKLKTLLLALGLSFGYSGVTTAATASQCETWEAKCIAGNLSYCRLMARYCGPDGL